MNCTILIKSNFDFAYLISSLDFHFVSKHKPVTSAELYQAFEDIIAQRAFTAFPFTAAFSTWETQKGFPVIHVRTDDANNVFSITQQRYFAASETKIDDGRSWYIPLSFATAATPSFDNPAFTDFFPNGVATKTIPYPAQFTSSQWFIFNKQQIGYYRVNYDTSNWDALISVLNSNNFKQIHVLNRAQLVDDALNLAADGYLSYDVAFNVLNYLSRETDYIPWRAAVTNLDKLDYLLKGRANYENFETFVKLLARRIYAAHGLDEKPSDTLMDKFARELAIDWTCRMGDAKCLADTNARLKEMALDGEAVPDSLQLTFVCNGLRGLNKQTEFVEIWKKMQSSTDQAERLRIIDGILCSSDPKVITSLLETTLTTSTEFYYRQHELTRIINNVYIRSPIGVTVMTDFLATYYSEFVSR